MIYLEDEEIEKLAFSKAEEVIIPIEVTYRDEQLTIVSFEKTLDVARKFEKTFEKTPFSPEAINFLDSELRCIVESWGYFVDDLQEGHIITYENSETNEKLVKPNTKKIKSCEKYENLTEHELEKIDSISDECYFVSVVDNKIVSVCEINSEEAFIGASEINVYTAPEYRKMGYGASNVTAMTMYLKSLGKRVAYTVNYNNKQSQLLAEKCGFKEIAHTYYYICYKDEENGI